MPDFMQKLGAKTGGTAGLYDLADKQLLDTVRGLLGAGEEDVHYV